jgi:hypothetical protein
VANMALLPPLVEDVAIFLLLLATLLGLFKLLLLLFNVCVSEDRSLFCSLLESRCKPCTENEIRAAVTSTLAYIINYKEII